MKMEETKRKAASRGGLSGKKDKLNLESANALIAETRGPEYWRSLEELAGSEEFQEMMHREFPKGARSGWMSVSRRGFLKLMGASMALAGMRPAPSSRWKPIVPYVRQPEDVIPGQAAVLSPARIDVRRIRSPVLVESHSAVPPRLREIRSIRRPSAAPTSSRRRRSSNVRSRPLPERDSCRRIRPGATS